MNIKESLSILCGVLIGVSASQYYSEMSATASIGMQPNYNPLLSSRSLTTKERDCLAKNMQEEAVSNNKNDLLMVAFGTINRVKSGRFPNTICGVVYEENQMSWTRLKYKLARPIRPKYKDLANRILSGNIKNPAPSCGFTNWYNYRLDSKNSHNYKKMMTDDSCVYKPSGTPHFYLLDYKDKA